MNALKLRNKVPHPEQQKAQGRSVAVVVAMVGYVCVCVAMEGGGGTKPPDPKSTGAKDFRRQSLSARGQGLNLCTTLTAPRAIARRTSTAQRDLLVYGV